jgi:transcriptional regulator with XRE-family HTH domain
MKKNEVKFPLQVAFFEKLKKTISKNISLADELAEVLGVSLDSAYRRLRGDSALSYDETMTICTKFNISPSIMENKETGFVNFTYKSLGVERVKLSGYLESIKKEFLQLHEFSNIHFYFAAEDVPLFHHLDFEYLTPFKYFYWRKSILNDTTLDGKKFDKKLISPEVINLSKEISRIYQNIESTEVWTEETISSTLSQITYYWDSGLFATKKDALSVCDDVEEMMEHLQLQAEMGTKFPRKNPPTEGAKNFHLYSCEVQIGNNSMLVQADQLKISLLGFNTFNSLQTFNLNYCLENERWIQNLVKKSILISSVSEKQRFQFFRKVKQMIEEVRKKIENE